MNIQENIPLKDYTTLGIGGPARYFVEVIAEEQLKKAIEFAEEHHTPHLIIAGGSNLLVNDTGFYGVVIKLSQTEINLEKDSKVRVLSGTSLQELVDFANEHGLAGIEKMTGIPGSVGGALYGNAGAYGQTISDKVIRIRVLENGQTRWMDKNECNFEYRESGFKGQKDIVILEAEFKFEEGQKEDLQNISAEILKKRLAKYPHGVRCPGSFFKNWFLADLPEDVAADAPKDFYGKVPAWYFLEKVGAKGAKRGKVRILESHANLIVNEGGGNADDFFKLAKEYKNKVKEKFNINLEPEVQLIGFNEDL